MNRGGEKLARGVHEWVQRLMNCTEWGGKGRGAGAGGGPGGGERFGRAMGVGEDNGEGYSRLRGVWRFQAD